MSGYNGWWDSIRTFLQQFEEKKEPPRRLSRPRGPKKEKTEPPPIKSLDDELAFRQIILKAMQSTTLLYMMYNGMGRYVEPYSYRWRTNPVTKKARQLFYGFCYKDQSINSFRLDRIEDLINTDVVYAPRWPVELPQ